MLRTRPHLRAGLIAVVLLLLLPCLASAAGISFRVTQADAGKEETVQTVYTYQKSKLVSYLFLPSGWDTASLRVWTDSASLSIDGQAVRDGDTVTCLQPGASVKLRQGKTSTKLIVMQTSSVPSVFLTTASGSLDYIHKKKTNEETGSVQILQSDGTVAVSSELPSLRCRGNSSFTLTKKKCYQFKLEKSQSVLGMRKGKTWILTAGFRDRGLIRNKLVYDMAKYVGMPYAIDACLVDLYINGEYRGVYTLSEKIQIGGNRLDITDLEKATQDVNVLDLSSYTKVGPTKATAGKGYYYDIPTDPDDITGGYLIRNEAISHYWETGSCYVTTRKALIQVCEPDYITKAQYDYISSLVQSFEDAIHASDGVDPKTGKHYTEIADLQSFVLKYMLEETAKSYDGNHNSQYMYKPADSVSTKLYAGPAWDYDTTFGAFASRNKKAALYSHYFWVDRKVSGSWYYALCRQSDFQAAVRVAWKERFRPAMDILLGRETDPTGTLLSVDEYADTIAASAAMDDIRWPELVKLTREAKASSSFSVNISRLKDFIASRRDWLDTQWGK